MAADFPYDLLEDPAVLAGFGSWERAFYEDLLAYQTGRMDEGELRGKWVRTVAILALDMSGLTRTAMGQGDLVGLLCIFDVQKVCGPVFIEHGALDIHTYADDFISVFDTADQALDAAFAVHHRIREFNRTRRAGMKEVSCCIGLGYGPVFRVGQNRATGDEMNRTSKLGEDTARGYETLLTEQFHAQVRQRGDAAFQRTEHESLDFSFYTAVPAAAE